MSGVIERTVDVAGVPVRLRAPDRARADALDANLAGFPATTAAPVATLQVVADAAPPAVVPARPPDDELDDFRYWRAADGMVVTRHDLVLHGDGDQVTAYQPDADDLWWLEEMVAFALTWVLARRARFVLHGAVVARDGQALLVLGQTGAGKSTLAAAALEAGWELLADDRLVVDTSDATTTRVYGFHHSPAIPREIGGPVTEAGTVLDDPRDRAELPRSVLATGGRTLVGVVLVAHSDRADGEVVPAARPTAFALILQSFAATSDPALREPIFRAAGELVQRPCFELRHALDPAHRRARAGVHLDEILAAIAAGEGEAGDLADPDDDGGVVSPGG